MLRAQHKLPIRRSSSAGWVTDMASKAAELRECPTTISSSGSRREGRASTCGSSWPPVSRQHRAAEGAAARGGADRHGAARARDRARARRDRRGAGRGGAVSDEATETTTAERGVARSHRCGGSDGMDKTILVRIDARCDTPVRQDRAPVLEARGARRDERARRRTVRVVETRAVEDEALAAGRVVERAK